MNRNWNNKNNYTNKRSYNLGQDFKTITIIKKNKLSKQYNLRGIVRDPQMVWIIKIGKT